SIGALAPALLGILRFLQGVMVGGEGGGARLMVVAYAAGKHRGRLSALSPTGGLTGQLLATGVLIVVTQLPKEAWVSWGW
ncbi:MFS transporter, partial [Salmonella enterica subsp. enterica serovar Infantis]